MKTAAQTNAHPRRSGWSAILAILLIALSWQSVVTQTHRHFHAPTGTVLAVAQDASSMQGKGQQTPFDPASDCSVCRQLAHAGAALLPDPVAIEAPVFAEFQPTETPRLDPASVQRSHAWQSRAPPALQA